MADQSPSRHVALLRGINVGTAKRIAMADLRAVVESLGCTGVRTVLQSGNVVFDAAEPPTAQALSDAIETATGVRAGVIVLDARRFRRALDANPLRDEATDPSRCIITFMQSIPDATTLDRPGDDELAPERLVFGADAVYQWLPDGVLATRLHPKFFERLGGHATGRNLRTAEKIAALL